MRPGERGADSQLLLERGPSHLYHRLPRRSRIAVGVILVVIVVVILAGYAVNSYMAAYVASHTVNLDGAGIKTYCGDGPYGCGAASVGGYVYLGSIQYVGGPYSGTVGSNLSVQLEFYNDGPAVWNLTSLTVAPPFSISGFSHYLPLRLGVSVEGPFGASIILPSAAGSYILILNATLAK